MTDFRPGAESEKLTGVEDAKASSSWLLFDDARSAVLNRKTSQDSLLSNSASMDTTSKAYLRPSLSQLTNLTPVAAVERQPQPTKGVVNNLVGSFLYSGLQGPVDGVAQIIDRNLDTSLGETLHVMDAPMPAKFGTADWAAQQVGGAAGMVVPYLLLHQGVSRAIGRPAMATSIATTTNFGKLALAESGVSALTGSIYGGVFMPVNPNTQDFLGDRLKNAATSGLTFGTLTAASVGLQGLGRGLATQGRSGMASLLTNEVSTGVISGVPAGIVHADAASLFAGKGLATWQERGESVATFSMVGGLFGAGQRTMNKVFKPAEGAPVGESQGAIGQRSISVDLAYSKLSLVEGRGFASGKGERAVPIPEVGKSAALEVGSVNTRYKGVEPGAVVERVINTKNGGRITMFNSGEKVLEMPGEPIKTEKPGGHIVLEFADGKVMESRLKSQIPFEEKPLNVASGAGEAVGKMLSNFTERPFVLDGKSYASVEAFYQGLKWPDAAKRAEVSVLTGKEAKYASRGSPKSETFEYNGTTIKFGSREHHELVKTAIRESLEQNPAMLKEFVETHPRPLMHRTGRRENPNSAFPGSVFTRILTEIRAEFVERGLGVESKAADGGAPKVAPGEGTTKSLEAGPKSSDASKSSDRGVASMSQGLTVSEVFKKMQDSGQIVERHNIDLYRRAFENFPLRARDFMSSGSDSVMLRLVDGNVLKITQQNEIPAQRAWDVPVLEKGSVSADGHTLHWFVQPSVQSPIARADFAPFLRRIQADGYQMTDPSLHNLGYYKGEARLLDPFSVVKIREN